MKKLTKAQVKKLVRNLKKGETLEVGFIPCKANPNSIWISPMWLPIYCEENFELTVNDYTYYNCNKEVGTYPHYYVKGGVK